MKSICIFCGSSDSVHADYKSAARMMGIIFAERGIRLIYGGGKTGLMGAVANGSLSAGGEVIGVIISSMNNQALAHDGLTRMDVTPNMHTRKARMHELANGFIALPGGFGTFDELFETITWSQIGHHYAHGVVDPIRELGQIALEKDVLLHVDGCMGGFLLPYFRRLGAPVPDFELHVPGVTSISMDFHKVRVRREGRVRHPVQERGPPEVPALRLLQLDGLHRDQHHAA